MATSIVTALAVGVGSAGAAVTAPVPLGRAAAFAVLSGASVANTVSAPAGPHTTLRGDLGVSSAGAITGFPPGVVIGTQHVSGTAATTGAQADLVSAYNDAAIRTGGAPLIADLIGATLTPGVHTSVGAVADTGTVTLDGLGDPDAVFILQINGGLSMAAGSKVVLARGAKASNVFWQVKGAAALGANVEFVGTIMALAAIGIGAGASVNGRALARTGAIALDNNQFYSNPPTMTIDGGDAATTADPTPTLSGTTDVALPATVTVEFAGQTLTAAVLAGETWSLTAPLVANGVYTVKASVADAVGNVSTATQELTVDTILPTVVITGGPTVLTNDSTPTISGTADVAGATLTVSIGGQSRTALVQVDGSWNVTPSMLADGQYTAMATVDDAAGNTGTATQTIDVDLVAPVVSIAGGPLALTNDATPNIHGISVDVAAGAVVVVAVDGVAYSTTVMSGAWSITANAIADGPHVVAVAISDHAGNTGHGSQTLTVDTVEPPISIAGGLNLTTDDPTPTIIGATSVAPGTIVTVTVAGQLMTTLVQLDGSWNATPTAIQLGTSIITASVEDPAGNTGVAQQTITVVGPDSPAVPVTVAGGSSTSTDDATPVISGTSTAPPGSTVTVTVGGQILVTTVQPNGTWSVTAAPLPNGPHAVVVATSGPNGTVNATQTLLVGAPEGQTPGLDFTPAGPVRLFDTRPGQSLAAIRTVAKVRIGAGVELQVRVTDLAGIVPRDGVGAVSLNVTVTEASAGGFVTVYACGTRESVSSVNFAASATVANAVIAPVSADGNVCFFSNTPVHVVADINGWFAANESFIPVGPKRVFDTRPNESASALRAVAKMKIKPGETLEVRLTDLAGFVPTGGVDSVSLNVTVTNPALAGFLTVTSCGAPALVSSVNFAAGQTVANAVVTHVSATGTVCFTSSTTIDLIVDVNGWFRTNSGFTGVSPQRVLDTRAGQSPGALRSVAKRQIGGAVELMVQVTDLVGLVPATAVGAVSLNVTATNPAGNGFVTVYACGTRGEVSSLNFAAAQTVANAVITPVSASGQICFYSPAAVDIVVDINGWFADS